MGLGAAYSGESSGLAAHVPQFARKVLVVGDAGGELARVLKARPGVEAHTLDAPDSAQLAFPDGHFDCVLVDNPTQCLKEPAAALARLERLLSTNGYVLLRVPNRRYYKADPGLGSTPEEIGRFLAHAGLGIYIQWPAIDAIAWTITPDAEGNAEVGGKTFRMASHEDREKVFAVEYVVVAVRTTYNPIDHAHELFRAGHPEWCYEVLELIPETYLSKPDVAVTVYADMQYCLAVASRGVPPARGLERFFMAQVLFYRVVSRIPDFREAYHTQAELWHRVGDDAMALRLLRSVQYVAPDEQTQRLIEAWPAPKPRSSTEPETVDWTLAAHPPRVLMVVTPGRPHFGMDVLYDGLCTVLGDGRVREFPWKKTLHGHAAAAQANYPCVFNRPGEPIELEQLLAEVRGGRFDLVLFCDLEHEAGADMTRRILSAAGHLPLFIVDVQDDPRDNRADVLAYLGRPSAHAYFKREMLACYDYGPTTHPLLFAYPDAQVSADISGPRPHPVFWAGHRQFGLRRVYLEQVEALLHTPFDKQYAPLEYVQALRASQIGINMFGFGYDTVRYWEVPAHGSMLLSERLPIRIPHNFRDGESAVFFDDANELEERLTYFLAHPEETAAIAAAGHVHLKEHHTASARARQLLGWIDASLRG